MYLISEMIKFMNQTTKRQNFWCLQKTEIKDKLLHIDIRNKKYPMEQNFLSKNRWQSVFSIRITLISPQFELLNFQKLPISNFT